MAKNTIIYVLPYEFYFTGLNNTVGGHTSHIIGVIEALVQKGFLIEIISDMPVPGLSTQSVRYFTPAFQAIRQLFRNLRESGKDTNQQPPFSIFRFGSYWLKLSISHLIQLIRYLSFFLGLFIITLRRCKRPSVSFIYYRHNLNGFIPALVSKITGVPSVVEVNTPISLATYYFWETKTSIRPPRIAWRERIQYEFSDVISVVSPNIQKWISEKCSETIARNILVNPNGVNPDSFRPSKNNYLRKRYNIALNEILIGMSAVFVSYNAIEELVEAFRLAREKYPKLRLLLMGESEMRGELEEHVRSQKLNGPVIFTGKIPFAEIGDYYSECDILVSHYNFGERPAPNCSIKHLEYMAAGKPVVATDIGYVNFAIKHDQNGLLVPQGNIHGFSEALLKLAADSDLRIKLGNQGRRDAVSCHSWTANINRILHRLSTERMN